MKEMKTKKERRFLKPWAELSTFSKVMIIALVALMAVQCVLTILYGNGIVLQWTGTTFLLNGAILCGLVLWGGGVFYLHRKEKNGKATFALAMVILLLMVSSSLYLGLYGIMATYLIPSRIADIVAKDGNSYSVLSVMVIAPEAADLLRDTVREDLGEEIIPVTEPSEVLEDGGDLQYGYSYHVYPKKWIFFVNTNVESKGGIFRRMSSTATLKQEVVDEDNDGTYDKLHLFLGDPGPDDFGEIWLSLHK